MFNITKNNSKNINRNTLMEEIFEGRISRGSSFSTKYLVFCVNLYCFSPYQRNTIQTLFKVFDKLVRFDLVEDLQSLTSILTQSLPTR